MRNTTNNLIATLIAAALLSSTALAATPIERVIHTAQMSYLAAEDEHNTPIDAAPGHTVESFCPEGTSENLIRQLDLTSTFISFEGSLMTLVSFYNEHSTGSTTEQFWFFDVDMDPTTGGGDNVLTLGPGGGAGHPTCGGELPVINASGFEAYIHSEGPKDVDLSCYVWDGATWVDVTALAGGANVQDHLDNPANPLYLDQNGLRAVADVNIGALVITGEFRLFARSWSRILCCGDNEGGEGQVPWECAATVCGDCDLSGFVNIMDALRAAQYDAGLATLSYVEFSNCNVSGSMEPELTSTVSILDALTISRYVVGIGTLECCIPPVF